MDSVFMAGKKLTDAINRNVTMMTRLEDMLLRQRLLERNNEEQKSATFILIFSILSISVLLYTFLRLRKESRLLNASIIDNNMLEAIVSDRTAEISSVNEKLNRQNEELAKKNDELNSFTFIASHDLKEPLRKIEMYGGKLQKEETLRLSDNGKVFLGKITDSIQRMKNLIDSIFSYAQVEQDIEREPVNLSDSLAQALNTLSETIEEKNAVIHCDELPTILAVPEQMEQLFTNLISNALKYAQKDIAPVIHISAKKMINDHWKIIVGDNGVGFDEKYKEKIFQIFQRAHSKTQYPGTGIGLAICRKIVENHHGSITAESSPDKGAVFTIIIPEKFK